jgi:hypothetical protein
MVSRILLVGVLLLQTASVQVAKPETRSIEGTYRNPALGYSIRIPPGLKGTTADQSGPERGVGISLPSGGTITVFGEPNSSEWKTPEEGLAAERPLCDFGQYEVRAAFLGKLQGAKGASTCGDRVLTSILAFHPHGGPIYWLQLKTTLAHESEDNTVLEKIATSFRLIRRN